MRKLILAVLICVVSAASFAKGFVTIKNYSEEPLTVTLINPRGQFIMNSNNSIPAGNAAYPGLLRIKVRSFGPSPQSGFELQGVSHDTFETLVHITLRGRNNNDPDLAWQEPQRSQGVIKRTVYDSVENPEQCPASNYGNTVLRDEDICIR